MRNRGVLAEESKQCGEETNQDLIQLGSWNPFETGDQESAGAKRTTTHSVAEHPSSLDVITIEAKEQSYHAAKEHDDDDDDSLVVLSKWSPSLIFNNYGFSQDVSLNQCLVAITSFKLLVLKCNEAAAFTMMSCHFFKIKGNEYYYYY